MLINLLLSCYNCLVLSFVTYEVSRRNFHAFLIFIKLLDCLSDALHLKVKKEIQLFSVLFSKILKNVVGTMYLLENIPNMLTTF